MSGSEHPRQATARRRRPGGAGSLLGAGLLLIAALHLLRSDVHPTRHYISEYANQEAGWVLSLAMISTGSGLVALAGGLARRGVPGVGASSLGTAGLLLAAASVVPTDREAGQVVTATLGGRLHGLAALAAFCLLVLAMVALPRAARAAPDPTLRRICGWALPLAGVAIGLTSAVWIVDPAADGLRQRAFLVVVFIWLLALAWRLPVSRDFSTAGPRRERASGDLCHIARGSR